MNTSLIVAHSAKHASGKFRLPIELINKILLYLSQLDDARFSVVLSPSGIIEFRVNSHFSGLAPIDRINLFKQRVPGRVVRLRIHNHDVSLNGIEPFVEVEAFEQPRMLLEDGNERQRGYAPFSKNLIYADPSSGQQIRAEVILSYYFQSGLSHFSYGTIYKQDGTQHLITAFSEEENGGAVVVNINVNPFDMWWVIDNEPHDPMFDLEFVEEAWVFAEEDEEDEDEEESDAEDFAQEEAMLRMYM
jgi:hypothetical protein